MFLVEPGGIEPPSDTLQLPTLGFGAYASRPHNHITLASLRIVTELY